MTNAAIFRGGQVVDVFTGSGHPIMAGRAVIHDTGMIKHRRSKRRRAVTVGAIPGGGYMVGWLTQGD